MHVRMTGVSDEIPPAIARGRPNLIVNAVTYAMVDHAEDEKDLAYLVNADALGTIARCRPPGFLEALGILRTISRIRARLGRNKHSPLYIVTIGVEVAIRPELDTRVCGWGIGIIGW